MVPTTQSRSADAAEAMNERETVQVCSRLGLQIGRPQTSG